MGPADRTESRNLLHGSPRAPRMTLAVLALGGGCADPVEPGPVITISPPVVIFEDAGEAVQLTATVEGSHGRTVPGVTVEWSSGDSLVAQVGKEGLVTSLESGTATIEASVGRATASITVLVEPTPRTALYSLYRAMGGDRWTDNTNWRTDEPLDAWHGVGTDEQGRITGLSLNSNGLVGSIPPQLGDLGDLTSVNLAVNELTGPIPPELGDLQYLRYLGLWDNGLTGSIPPELGNLTELDALYMDHNNLTGSIPPELGNIRDMWGGLVLSDNDLTGPIPPELGNMWRVDYLWLQNNRLSGPIPGELGRMRGASEVNLSNNSLTGPIPDGLGRLRSVKDLFLHSNDLSGSLPAGLSGLESLENLTVTNNPKMSGPIAEEFTEVETLVSFITGGTKICAPDTKVFHDWLRGIPKRRVHICDREVVSAYLVQQVQEREYPVPLVPGRDGLLRVFVTATKSNTEDIPEVVATFYVDDEKSHEVTIASKDGPIPTKVDEGSLAKSSNAEIDGSKIEPGLEMVIEIDPDNTLEDGLLTTKRMPSSGRFKFEIDEMPSFDLTLVPFLWEEEPDSGIIDIFEEMEEDEEDDYRLHDTYDLLPITGVNVSVHDPVMSSSNDTYRILQLGLPRFRGRLVVGVDGV